MAATEPSQHPEARYPGEPPTGGYALWSTSRGVMAMVREDDPEQPNRPDRWRKVDGTSRWYSWHELHSTGTLQRMYTTAELVPAPTTAAGSHLGRQPVRPTPESVLPRHQPHYHRFPAHPTPRPPAGDRRLLAAIGDGRVFVYETGRHPQVHTRGLSIRRDDLQVAAPAITTFRQRWAAGLTGKVHVRLARLFSTGLIAAPVEIGRPDSFPPGRPEPYLLTRAGQQAVTRSLSYRGHPQPMTLEYQRWQATGGPSAVAAAAAAGPRRPVAAGRNPTAGPPPNPSTPAAPGHSGLAPGVIRSTAHTAARPTPDSLTAAPASAARPPEAQLPTIHGTTRGRP